MGLLEAENMLPALHLELDKYGIKHGEFVHIQSGRNYVFSDRKHVVCKIEGNESQNNTFFANEIRVAHFLTPLNIATSPALNELIQVEGSHVSVWVWQEGETFLEEHVTPTQVMFMLEALTNFHNVTQGTKKLELLSLYDVLQLKAELIDGLHMNDFMVNEVRHLINIHIKQMQPMSNFSLLHGDAHMGNFIVNANQAFMCDLENVCLGEPEYDFGSLLYLCYRKGASNNVLRMIKNYCISQGLNMNKIVDYGKIKAMQNMIDNVLAGDIHKLSARLQSLHNNRLMQL